MASDNSLTNSSGHELSSVEWLQAHHGVKLKRRIEMVRDLPLAPGQRVLDIGCGPGLWSWMFAEYVAPEGRVVGIDIDLGLLDAARSLRPPYIADGACTFRKGDMYRLDEPDGTYDLTFSSNCYVYATDPRAVLREQMRVTTPGGYVVGRHFDHTCLILHPAPVPLVTRVAAAAAAAEAHSGGGFQTTFRNAFGQRLHGLFKSEGLESVRTCTYAVQLTHPLSDDAKRYVSVTALWYLRLAGNELDASSQQEWQSLFSLDSSHCVIDDPAAFFVFLEMQTVGKNPGRGQGNGGGQ